MPTLVAETVPALRAALADHRTAGRSVALVPTMGALHQGHLELVSRAKQRADVVVVSIFVNPLQFAPTDDLDRYPRTLDEDLAKLNELGVDLLFLPSVDEMYPDGQQQTHVVAGPIGSRFEGRSRAGHFDGVLTVVAKLINIAAADTIVFGQKDAQQLFLVERMVKDLDFPVRVEVVPTVRESSGLALSSRNRFLGPEERKAALALSSALEAAESSGDRGVDAVLAAGQAALASPLVELDYFAVVDPATFLPVDDDFQGRAQVLVAARVGRTRLIDNASVFISRPV